MVWQNIEKQTKKVLRMIHFRKKLTFRGWTPNTLIGIYLRITFARKLYAKSHTMYINKVYIFAGTSDLIHFMIAECLENKLYLQFAAFLAFLVPSVYCQVGSPVSLLCKQHSRHDYLYITWLISKMHMLLVFLLLWCSL